MKFSPATIRARALPQRLAFSLAAAAALASCGGGSNEAQLASQAAPQRERALAAALNQNGWVAVNAPNDALMQNLAIPADAPARGMWSAVGAWPMVGVNQAVLPDGKVLTWGTTPDGGAQNGRYFDLWDPNRGLADAGSHNLSYDPARQDSFCAPAVFAADGRLLITGGNGTNNNGTTSQYYSPSGGSFTQGPSVADARWYAAMVTLPDGRSMMLGGINPYTEGQFNDANTAVAQGLSSMTPEVLENGNWRSLFGAQSRTAFGPDFLRASLPKTWVAPDGTVFGIGTEQMYYVDANAGGGNGAITIVGAYKTAPGPNYNNDTAPNVGPTMTAVMYAPGKVLTVGGNAFHNGIGWPASRKATAIDLNGGGAVMTEQPLMAFPRNFANTIVLPDGKVLVTGGETVATNDPARGVFAAEMWNPATGGWTTLASAAVFRAYHSQTSLLTNGTVLSTGGGNPGPVQLKGEVFYPPYLFRTVNGAAQLAPRPQFVGISGLKHNHGAQLQFDLSNANGISQVALIGLSVGTHSFNAGQRRIPLSYTQDNFRITATVPNANLTPPGYYQLVAVDANGVPSRGTIVAIGANVAAPAVATNAYVPPDTGTGTPPPPPASTPPANATACAAEGQACTLPAGSSATVWYGADTRWASRAGVTGSIACDNATFGDPAFGTVKSCLYILASTTPTPPPSGGSQPVGAWSFDSATGSTAPDSSANNRALSLANTALVAGKVGNALQFNGINASGSTAAPVLDTAGSFTAATWVRLDQLSGWRTFVNQDGVNASGFWLQYSEFVGSKFLLSMHDADTINSAPFRAVGTTTPLAGLWYHVVGVRDKAAGTMKIYVNGRLEGTTAYSGGWAATGTLNVGRGKFGGPNDWVAGALDQVKVFNTALSDAAVAALYNADTAVPVSVPSFNAPLITAGGTANYSVAATAGITYSWDFGDGSAATAFSATASATKVFANAGVYGVTLTARAPDGSTAVRTVLQAVGNAPTAQRPTASSAIALETRAGASARAWVANPDSDTVAVIDTATNARVAEIAVGNSPRSVAIAPDGRVWVVNKGSSTLSILNPATLTVAATVALPRAAQPHGLAFAPGGSAFVVLEATGQLLKLDPASGATQATLAVGANPRHVSVSADSALVLVSRFITNPLPGEATATVDTSAAGAEVVAVNAGAMTLNKTIVLRHSDKVDNEIQGAGIPNYLAAAVISPDGLRAWVPSKQDNIKRGTLRNAQGLNFQNTVRAISSRIDMGTLAEDAAARIDHDNSSLGSAAAYHPSGAYLFVALETSRQVAIVDPVRARELLKLDVGRAPQAVAVSADGTRLFVQNFMDRSISVFDLGPLVNQGQLAAPVLATVGTIGAERLSAQVLLGKQLFYDARDPRLARDSYMSCASCHSDAGHDGRTWDFTGFGEGLRNTPALKGRAGTGQGFVHWSANFDELQDFEGQIRNFAGGTGLMPDAQFNTGTRNQPLGDRKAGLSADLDALAAYLGSLNSFDPSPLRNGDGSLSAAAAAGKTVFTNANCGACHGGNGFTVSADAGSLKNVGTIKPSSGQRLGAALPGIDVPTLRDVWKTAPYLHDGSAATLAAAVQAHQGNTVAPADLANLTAYLQQIGAEEGAAPGTPAPVLGTGSGLTGAYFNNTDLSGSAVLTRTEAPWFDWGTNAPAANVPADNFSVRWSGELQAVEGGNYQFRTNSDDGVRVWVNGVQVINNWTVHAPTVDTSGLVALSAGQRVSIVVEFQEFGGGAVLQLSWLRPGGAWAPVPATQLYGNAVNTGPMPPASAQFCANEGATCALPANSTASVWFGSGSNWFVRTGLSGSVGCNTGVFGDPIVGTVKTCRYLVTGTAAANRPPSVSLTAPGNNSSVTQGALINLAATAADSDGSVARVEFYDGGTLLNTDTSAPYAFSWAGAAVGSHSLTARAFDNAGALSTSAAITVTVNAPPASPPASATQCAAQGGTCTFPAGTTATVWFGSGTRWRVRTGVSGSIGCNSTVFGNPGSLLFNTCRALRN